MLTVALGFSTVFIILIGRLIYLIGFEGGVDYKLMALKGRQRPLK